MLDEKTDELKIVACGWQEGDEHEGTHGTTAIPVAQEQSLVARAARTRQPVIVNDVRNEPGWLPNPQLPDTRAEMAVPLVVGNQVLGVMDVQSDRINAFTEEDANIQMTLASQVSTSLQNAQSYTAAQKQAERETKLNIIAQKIQAADTIEEAMQVAARELGHALGKRQTFVALDPTALSGGSRVEVTEQEVDHLLATAASFNDQNREYHLGHILVSVPEAASPEDVKKGKARAEDIIERLRDGADFESTAIAESDGQQALEGGDLGWRKTGQLPSFFSDVVDELKTGQISNPIRSPSGFHIIKILDIRGDQVHLIKQTKARHILLRPDTLVSEEDVQIRIRQLHERIVQGEDFGTLARAHSQDPGSGSDGGELGWVTPGKMVPEFEKAMDELQVGEVSQPIKSRFGYPLNQGTDRRELDNTEDYQRTRARESIRQRKTEEELEIWLRRLRDESYVEYHLDQ
jgi:parvulin-like peptidyl-prolyl isomerase